MAKFSYTVFCIFLSIAIHHYCYFEPSHPDDTTPKPILFLREMTHSVTRNLYRLATIGELSNQDEIDNEDDTDDAKVETEQDEVINKKAEELKLKADKDKRDQMLEISEFRSFLVNRAFEKAEYEKLRAYFSDNFDKKRGYLMLAIADKNYADFTTNFALRLLEIYILF